MCVMGTLLAVSGRRGWQVFEWAGVLAGRRWVGQLFCEAVIWCGGCTTELTDEWAGGRVVGQMEWVALRLGRMRRMAIFGRA